MNELALFSGAGGGILGGTLLGWRTVCAVECDAYAASVPVARQNDGMLEPFPIWDDVRTFDGRQWRGAVDVVSGGFPCQDISSAGRGAGIDGERSGLWGEMARIIGEVRPRFAFVENSPMLTVRGLGRVLGDLAALGYDAEWGVLGAHHVGAPHRRDRIWIVAHAARFGGCKESERCEQEQSVSVVGGQESNTLAHTHDAQCQGMRCAERGFSQPVNIEELGAWWRCDPADEVESRLGRVADGVAHRVDRIRAIGNGQVPSVAALAWSTLVSRLQFPIPDAATPVTPVTPARANSIAPMPRK